LNFIVYSRLAALLSAAVLLTVACASAPSTNGGALLGLEAPLAVSTFSFERDTFAFPNMIRSRHPDDEPGLYANYCFVLARGIRQFAQYVRFDPALPGSITRDTSSESRRSPRGRHTSRCWPRRTAS
jgi:hypothetical protein